MAARWLGVAATAWILATTGIVPPAAAQPAPEAGTAAPESSPRTRADQSLSKLVEQRIADLHRRLRITPDEEPQWTAFAQAMRQNAARTDQVLATQQSEAAHGNALQSLDAYAQLVEQHADDLKRLVPLFQALYDKMPEAQKQQTDQVFRDFARRENRRHG